MDAVSGRVARSPLIVGRAAELATAEQEAFDQSVSLTDAVTPVEIRRKRFPASELSVDEAAEYVMHRWPLSLGASIAAQFRSAMRFEQR